MMAAMTLTFFFSTCTSSSVTARFCFAWILLILSARSSLRTGKNRRAAKAKDVTPNHNVCIRLKKGTPDSVQLTEIAESLRRYGLTVTAYQHQALLS